MTLFVSKWSTWNGGGYSTDKTDKSTSRGIAPSNLPTDKTDKSTSRGIALSDLPTDKTDKSPIGSSVSEDEYSVSVASSNSEAEDIAAMSLVEFARARLIIRLHSGVLGCEVLFVSDNIEDFELPETDLAIYRASELLKIAILRPEPRTLRYLHEVKTILNGSITDVQPSGEC